MATSSVAKIREVFDVEADAESGKLGQFTVEVDGKVVLDRKKGLMTLLTKKPWPSVEEVITAIKSV